MLDIAYGHTATSADDELIMLADTVVREAMDTGSLAGTLVDFFPAREYSRIARAEGQLLTIHRPSVQYIPSWFPGGGFKRRAAWIRGMMRDMYDRPYAQAKADVVS